MSHKFIKDAGLWEKGAVETCRTLKKLNKGEDAKKFLQKMVDVFLEVINKPEQVANRIAIS